MNAQAEKELLKLGFKKLSEHSYRLELSGVTFNVDTKMKKVKIHGSYVMLATNGIDVTASVVLDSENFNTSLAMAYASTDEYGKDEIALLMRFAKFELVAVVSLACKNYHSYKPVVKAIEDAKLPELVPSEKEKPQTRLF